MLTLIAENKPDILLLQETWLKPNIKYAVPDYHVYRKDRHPGRKGGVATLVHKDLIHEEILLDLGKAETSIVKVRSGKKSINICSAYFPGRTTRKSDVYELNKLKPHALIAGDFNARNLIWGSNKTDPIGKYIENLCTEKEFTIHVPTTATRRSLRPDHADSTIDYALTTDDCSEIDINVLENSGTTSDHLPLLITANYDEAESSKEYIKISTNWDKVAEDLNKRPWQETGDTNYDVEHFTRSAQASIFNHSKGVKLKDPRHLLLPYQLKSLMEEKRKAVRQYYKLKTPQNKRNMKRLKKKFDQMYRKQAGEKMEKEMESLNDPTLRWIILKKGRPQPPPIPTLTYGGKTATTTQEKANMLGEALQEKFFPINSDQDPELTNEVKNTYLEIDKEEPGEIPIITIEEIKKAIKNASSKSATGPDGISYKLLKKLSDKTLKHLANIFSNILKTRKFPEVWKEACVTMLHKNDKPRQLPASYRPISLLSCLSKIFERCLQKHIVTKKLPNHQFGFRPKHSTTHQLTRIVQDATKNINQNWSGIIVSLDIEAAFDKVPHHEMILKLKKQKQPTWLIQLIKSYYQQRKFHIRLNGKKSSSHLIHAGTAQGAVISATLYSLYIADMPYLEDISTYQYADDTAYLCSTHKLAFSALLMNEQLDELYKWCQQWKTKINPTKSTAIILASGKREPVTITYGNEEIPISGHFKYLGVQIDKRLYFTKHVDHIISTATAKTATLMGVFQKKKIVTTKSRALFYQMLILPSITYGFPAWGCITNNQLKRILKIERKWIRICLFLPRSTPVKTLYELIPFKSIFQIRREIATKMRVNIKNHANPCIREIDQYLTPGRRLYPLQQWDNTYAQIDSDDDD